MFICNRFAIFRDLILAFFSGTARKLSRRSVKNAFKPIWLTNLTCTGEEVSVFDCEHSRWSATNCTHDQDVYITCDASKTVSF